MREDDLNAVSICHFVEDEFNTPLIGQLGQNLSENKAEWEVVSIIRRQYLSVIVMLID
jgi:hypothetical protein